MRAKAGSPAHAEVARIHVQSLEVEAACDRKNGTASEYNTIGIDMQNARIIRRSCSDAESVSASETAAATLIEHRWLMEAIYVVRRSQSRSGMW